MRTPEWPRDLLAALAALPRCDGVRGDGTAELGPINQLNVRARRTDGLGVNVTFRGAMYTSDGCQRREHCQALAVTDQCDQLDRSQAAVPPASASAGATIQITTTGPVSTPTCSDMYAVAKNDRLKTTAPTAIFTGGSSDATWRVELDFHALGIDESSDVVHLRASSCEWASVPGHRMEAAYTNWQSLETRTPQVLKVAGPGSVRMEENDSWCKYAGPWTDETGFFSEGFAKHASRSGSSVTIKYACSRAHDLYLGTSL